MDGDPAKSISVLQNVILDGSSTQGTVCTSQGLASEDGFISGYTASEKAIAALGLAALDGAQEGEGDSAVKTEAQGAQDLTALPPSKPATRGHKPPRPSEGSSDKRFLCYICIKLFTRRRSVRDHIKKIHNDNNFDMARAIEVTVDPETGESVIPLAELVRTLPPPSAGQQAQISAPHPASRASSVETNTFSTPAPIARRKRSAPDMAAAQATALKKKGTAKPKPVNTSVKKANPEIDISTEIAAAFRSPSGTPVSSRASKPPASTKPRKQPTMSLTSSPAPSDRISVALATDNEADEEVEQAHGAAEGPDENGAGDDGEVFCICRKGDNHTWMIACDGGCEDWFHGKCVDIEERDGDLIDKYICPSCEDKGRGQTTWKRMCRRKECRKPARVLAAPPSKYCSDECNKRFWVGMVRRSDPSAVVSEDGLMVTGSKVHHRSQEKKKRKRKRVREDEEYHDTNKDGESDYLEGGVKRSPVRKKSISSIMVRRHKDDYVDEDGLSSDDEPPLSTRGGALSVGDIKMMLNQAKTVDEIRRLGQKPPTPPYTSDAEAEEVDTGMANGVDAGGRQEQNSFPYNHEEQAQLERLSAKKRRLRDQLQLVRDQEKLLAMVKSRSAAVIEGMGVPKAKNVCGFDARLSWSSAEFGDWRNTPAGRMALQKGEIGDPDASLGSVEEERHDDGMVDAAENEPDEEEYDGGDDARRDDDIRRGSLQRGICIRSKCPRHRDWRRLLASEHKFEEEGIRKQLAKLETEGREVRERAAMRMLCEQG